MSEAADAGPEGLGPLEREARHLVEAAARWLSAVPDPDQVGGEDVDGQYAEGSAPRTGSAEHEGGTADAGGRSAAGERTAAGHGEEHLCRGCPWCRAKAAFGGPLGADTLDSIAHLLGSAAESLALMAQARREAAERAADHDPTDEMHEGEMHEDERHEEDEEMLEAVIWVDEEDDEEATEEQRRTR